MSASNLNLVMTPLEFFHDRVNSAQAHLKIELDESIEFYLVNLLCDFVEPNRLGKALGGMEVLETPLAFLLKDAMEAPPGLQIKMYKRLGDLSLYFAGYFQEYFNRRSYDVDYYISMGSCAYNTVSSMIRDRHRDEHFRQIYLELAMKFAQLVDVVADVASTATSNGVVDILSVYSRWAKSNSGRLRRVLEDAGIEPMEMVLKKAQ